MSLEKVLPVDYGSYYAVVSNSPNSSSNPNNLPTYQQEFGAPPPTYTPQPGSPTSPNQNNYPIVPLNPQSTAPRAQGGTGGGKGGSN